jgi:hypothetical protein
MAHDGAMRVSWSPIVLWVSLALAACSSSESEKGKGPSSVAEWTCCAFGETTGSCACYEDMPGSAHGCSPSVSTCNAIDGGVGCCVATPSLDDGWLCECWPAGTDCSGMMSAGSESVPSCPP